MSKPSKLEAALAVMSAVTAGGLDQATAADFKAVLDGAAAGQSLTKSLDRALSAARSRTWEMVSDAGLAAAAEGAPRSARSRLRQAVASAAAVRALENRLSGDGADVQNDTAADVDVDAEIVAPAASPADDDLHVESDTDSGAGWGTQNDDAEVQL